MKPRRITAFLTLSLIIALCFSGSSIAKEVSRDKAIQIAKSIADTRFPADWAKNKTNIRVQASLKSNYPFYICDVDGGGFVLVAEDDRCPPVLGFSFESSFSTELSHAPASLESYFEALRTTCSSYINETTSYPSVREFWDEFSVQKSTKTEKSLFIPALMTTKWKVDSSFCADFPVGGKANASPAITMGQVFRYFEYPKTGFGEYCYLYKAIDEEICGNFGDVSFDFASMPDESANDQIANLLYFMAVACRLQSEGADLLTLRETMPIHFFYSDNMRRIEYWQHDFIKVLKHQLSMKRPVPAEWKGHTFVIDGYYDTNFFHFNLGMGGEFDGYYFLDFPNVTAEADHVLLSCFINYHPKSRLPIPQDLSTVAVGDSLNISWNISLPDSLLGSLDRYILLRDGVVPVVETTSTSVMMHPQDFGISSEINCIAVYSTYGASELSEPYTYISDKTLANIPSLELRQAINIQLGYTEDLNRMPFVGELEMVNKLEIDFQDQRGIDQLTQLKYLFIDGISLYGISEGNYLNGLSYLMFHRCRQFDFTVIEKTNSLSVIRGSDGLPYDFYHLRHNSNAGVISFTSHDAIFNNCYDLYGADKYFQNLSSFDVSHMTGIRIDSCYISYESYQDVLPNIKGSAPALEHTSPSSFAPCYPSPARNSNVPNTSQISWQANFHDDPDVYYNIYIGKTRDRLPIVGIFSTGNTYDYSFENNLDYYWRVESFHNDTTYYSGIYHFSTFEAFPMPFVEDFDDYYAKCDVSYESPFWVNYSDVLSEPAKTSRSIKRSGRYSLEFTATSDAGILLDPNADSAYVVEFYFRNNRAEFGIEFMQGSNDGDTLAVNSRIGLYGDNLGTFNFGESSSQFFFIPNDWNLAQLALDMPSGKGTLIINEVEIAQWNWNMQKDGITNTNPFQGIRFSNAAHTGYAFIDDLNIKFAKTTGIEEIINDWSEVSYSSQHHEILIHDNSCKITGVELYDLSGRKIAAFARNGEQRYQLDDGILNGVYVMIINIKEGRFLSRKISIVR